MCRHGSTNPVLIKALKFKGFVSVPQDVTLKILFILHTQSTNMFIAIIMTAMFSYTTHRGGFSNRNNVFSVR
jgi:hypothetical protein